jgi:UDP-N-acetylmuramate: L-alanyl-gamma-D-glutamyl-meso-diaminopimelate ligase
LRAAGKPAWAFASAAEIAEFLASQLQEGNVVLVMSNGSFDGLCERLLQQLTRRAEVAR